jgi:Molybdopterin-binding domain of aldehyde dehydrogenase/Amidohydrolase
MAGVTVVRDGQFTGVTAADPASARRAVAAVRADWERPPAGPAEMASYLRGHPAAGQGWERPVDRYEGDVEAALAGAATRVQASYATAYLAHVPLETRAAVAAWDGGRLTVWTGCNVPFAVRGQLADALGIDQADVRVIVPPTGGGFGGKHGEEAIEAARLARAAGRPVKVHWSRAEEFGWGYLRPMAVIDVRAGLDAGGAITAWDFLDINAGAQGTAFPYATASWRLRYQPAASPLAQGPYRALAATANTFARESCLDELAHAAGADPLQFRLDHLADQRLAMVVRAAAARFGWTPGQGQPARPGWGIAAGLEKDGRVATCAEVRAGPAGQLTVTRIVTAYECGAIVNPDTVAGQVPHLDQSLAEIARVAAEPSVAGFTLGCSVAGRQLDDPALDPALAELDRRGSVVFLHPVGQEDTPWLAGHNLAWLVGAPFEDTAAALRLVLAGVPDRYPGLRFIIPHLGGTIPFLLARITRKSAAQITRGLRGMYYDTVSGSAEALASASRLYGAGRLLFGTDYPYCDEPQFRHHLSYLSDAGLDPAELAQITGGTAAALLGVHR